MESLFHSLIPLATVIGVTVFTHELRYGLIAAIFTAGTIVYGWHNPFLLCNVILQKMITYISNADTLFLYGFLLSIPMLINLLIETKTTHYFTLTFKRYFTSKQKISYATCFSSIFLCLDDYLSIITVGNVMRPIYDKLGMARAKLAYFIHALSGPMVILFPLSSWVATITSFLSQAGISKESLPQTILQYDPFGIYLQSIPFILYSILTLLVTGIIINYNMSYGPMQESEKQAVPTTIFETNDQGKERPKGLAFVYSFLILFGLTVFGIFYQGNSWILGGTAGFIETFLNLKSIFSILCYSSISTLVIITIYFLYRKQLTLQKIPYTMISGALLMTPVIQMTLLTSMLSDFLKNDLKIGAILAQYLHNTTAIECIPIGFFITAMFFSLTTGSSWATFGILLNIAIAIINNLNLHVANLFHILLPTLGAIFSGALCGDHISPFSETTLMSAQATLITPYEHTKTQLLYVVPIISGCIIGFSSYGLLYQYSFVIQYTISLGSSILTSVVSIYMLQKIFNRET